MKKISNKNLLQKFFKVNNISQLKVKIPGLKNLPANQIYSLIKISLPQIERNYAVKKNIQYFEKLQTVKHNRKINEFKEKVANRKIQSFLKERLKIRPYFLNVTYRRIFKKSGKEFIVHETKGPYNDNRINDNVKALNVEDDYKIEFVVDYTVQYMNIETYNKNKKPPGKQLMRKDGYNLRNGWLRYASGISEKAFHDSNNKCVYYQLVDFLLNPKTGRPTKFLDIGVKMNEENFYQYFYHTYSTYNEDDTIT